MSLGDMIEIVTKNEPCIKKLSCMKYVEHTSPAKPITENQTKVEANHVAHKKQGSSPPKHTHQYTPLTDIVDNILNILLDEELIELPPIVVPKFTNGVPKSFHCKKFCNYYRVHDHLIWDYMTLHKLIQDFIDNGAIRMDQKLATQTGLVHLDNAQLGVFNNPLPFS